MLAAMRVIEAVILFASVGLFIVAKPIHAPLPATAYTAKTIAIINHSGKQMFLDRAYDELQKWGRFALVQDATKADMVLVIQIEKHSTGASAYSYGNSTSVAEQRVLDVTTSFILNGSQEPFFSETERAAPFRKSATKRCIDDFRKRLEEVR
jgi:hypothetical protein